MTMILAGAQLVSMDEPCLLLTEQNLVSPDSRGWRRYQILVVMRVERPAEMRIDMGPAKSFAAQQFRIPGGARDGTTGRYHVEHTVGELRDIADYIRSGKGAQPETEPSDLIAGYHDEMGARRYRARGRRGFGVNGLRRVN